MWPIIMDKHVAMLGCANAQMYYGLGMGSFKAWHWTCCSGQDRSRVQRASVSRSSGLLLKLIWTTHPLAQGG